MGTWPIDEVTNTDTDGHNDSYATSNVCIPNVCFMTVGMSKDEYMAESKVRNGNEVETICDTAIRLFINSVTKQLVTKKIYNRHAIN